MQSVLVGLIVLVALLQLGRHCWRWLQPLLARPAPGTQTVARPLACAGCPQRAACPSKPLPSARRLPSIKSVKLI